MGPFTPKLGGLFLVLICLVSMVLADFGIEKSSPLFSYLLTKSESDLYPFALVISSRDYRSARFVSSQLVLLVH
jgi:hypothetical protein